MYPPELPSPQPFDGSVPGLFDLISLVEEQIGPRTLLPLRIVNRLPVRGWSLTVPDTRIHVGITCWRADDDGSFAAGTDPRLVTARISPFPGEFDNTTAAIRASASTLIPDVESEAWIRVALGRHLADYAYQLTDYFPVRGRPQPHKHRFAVLVDGMGRPLLAPDNMRWRNPVDADPPRKLEPTSENIALRDQLARTGPYTESALIRDPRTDPDGGWRLELTGDRLDTLTPIAREAVEEALQQFRVRGTIHTDLQAERLTVDGDILYLQFRWRKNPNTFAISIHIPQSEAELRSPAVSPGAWMSYGADHWREELSTGWVRWARREIADGVVHLGRRDEPPQGEYSVSIVRGLPTDQSGLLHIHHSPHLQTDTFADAAYHPDNLISYSVATQRLIDAPGARTIITSLASPILADYGFIAEDDRWTLDVLSMKGAVR